MIVFINYNFTFQLFKECFFNFIDVLTELRRFVLGSGRECLESGLFSNNNIFLIQLWNYFKKMFSGGFRGFGDFGGFGGEEAEDENAGKKEVDNNKYYELIGVTKSATIE